MFVRNPHEIYQDIYNLVKMGFSAEYVENISPAERGVYKGYYMMESRAGETAENAKAAADIGLDIEDLL